MSSYYEELHWDIDVSLDVHPEFISVSLEYTFQNASKGNKFYFSLLPRFQSIPIRSLLGEDKFAWIEGQLLIGNMKTRTIFSEKVKVEGIAAQSDCHMPIPWPCSDQYIPPDSLLKLRFHWVELGPNISSSGSSRKRWVVNNCLPLSKLFLPFEISEKKFALANPIINCERINWLITFPEGVSFERETQIEDFKPFQKDLVKLSFSHVKSKQPQIFFHLTLRDRFFEDHSFKLPVDLVVPIAFENELFNAALQKIKEYTHEVIVAVVDLRGSSDRAEDQRDLPIPIDYTLKFHNLARGSFPQSLYSKYSDDPLNLLMKKIAGDMLILVAPAANALSVTNSILKFLSKLTDAGLPFRAGFHVDQATDTGNFMYSLNEFGTDFLGSALNWAAKIGDDKKNCGVRLTGPVKHLLSTHLCKCYDLIKVESLSRKPDLEIFELKEKSFQYIDDQNRELKPFADRLCQKIIDMNSRVCVGLDPDLAYFPDQLLSKYDLSQFTKQDFNCLPLDRVVECIIEFNKLAIDAVCDIAVAVKPQSAHYERFGHFGIIALEESVKYAKQKNLIVILDAKRNDIGSTAEKYANAYLGSEKGINAAAIAFDAITINPYLGYDGIKPFVDLCVQNNKGIFILVKTSNKSSGDFQDLQISKDNCPLSHNIASKVNDWGENIIGEFGYSAVGAVVGATYPEDIPLLREKMPNSIFLVPGYGAQGATAEDIAKSFDKRGLGVIINSSRAILYPDSTGVANFQDKIRIQAIKMKDDINHSLSLK